MKAPREKQAITADRKYEIHEGIAIRCGGIFGNTEDLAKKETARS